MSDPDWIIDSLPRLRRYARALTGERYAADDLVQDTLERALTRFALFRYGSNIDAWLFTVMHRIFINQYRARSTHPEEAMLDDATADGERVLSARATQSDQLEVHDIDRALARLPVEQREVLLLICLEDLSYEDTARVLGIPSGTVMSRLHRAREKLRDLLGESVGRETHSRALKVVK